MDNNTNSKNEYWESRSYANNLLLILIMLIPLALIVSVPIIINTVGFGTAAIVMLVLFAVSVAGIGLGYNKLKWYNPHLIFSLTVDGLYFTTDKHPESSFFNEYANIDYYTVKENKNGHSTVVFKFKKRTDAGVYGHPISITMFSVRNADLMKEVLSRHGIVYKK